MPIVLDVFGRCGFSLFSRMHNVPHHHQTPSIVSSIKLCLRWNKLQSLFASINPRKLSSMNAESCPRPSSSPNISSKRFIASFVATILVFSMKSSVLVFSPKARSQSCCAFGGGESFAVSCFSFDSYSIAPLRGIYKRLCATLRHCHIHRLSKPFLFSCIAVYGVVLLMLTRSPGFLLLMGEK